MDELNKIHIELAELAGQNNRSISFVIFFVNVVFDELWIADTENFLELIEFSQDNIPMNWIRHFSK